MNTDGDLGPLEPFSLVPSLPRSQKWLYLYMIMLVHILYSSRKSPIVAAAFSISIPRSGLPQRVSADTQFSVTLSCSLLNLVLFSLPFLCFMCVTQLLTHSAFLFLIFAYSFLSSLYFLVLICHFFLTYHCTSSSFFPHNHAETLCRSI